MIASCKTWDSQKLIERERSRKENRGYTRFILNLLSLAMKQCSVQMSSLFMQNLKSVKMFENKPNLVSLVIIL